MNELDLAALSPETLRELLHIAITRRAARQPIICPDYDAIEASPRAARTIGWYRQHMPVAHLPTDTPAT